MPFMPADSKQTAAAVSAAIYRLTRPAGSEISDTTRYLFGWRVAGNGTVWMVWESSSPIPVHAGRGAEIEAVLAGFVASGHLSQQSADAVLATAGASVGNIISLAEITPPEWAALMLPDEQADALFPPAEISD